MARLQVLNMILEGIYAFFTLITGLSFLGFFRDRSVSEKPKIAPHKVMTGIFLIAIFVSAFSELAAMFILGENEKDSWYCLEMIDSMLVPMFFFYAYTLLHDRFPTRKVLLTNLWAFVVPIVALFVRFDWMESVVMTYGVAYLVFIVIYFSAWISRRTRAVQNTYADLHRREVSWFFWAIVLVLIQGFAIAAGYYLPENVMKWFNAVYYGVSTLFWIWISYCVLYHRESPLIADFQEKEELLYVASANTSGDGEANSADNIEHQIAERLQQAMDDKVFLDPDISVVSLASRVGTNKTYLSQYINHALGVTFSAYITEPRIDYAANLLLTTQKKVADISVESGFNNDRTFRAAFLKKYGCTPSEYRTQHT